MIGSFYNGYKVIVTDQNAGKPVKPHNKKPYMSDFYHMRVQKKWIKKHGRIGKVLRDGECVIDKLNNTILMNVETHDKFIKQLRAIGV